jgi:hypothetical protein
VYCIARDRYHTEFAIVKEAGCALGAAAAQNSLGHLLRGPSSVTARLIGDRTTGEKIDLPSCVPWGSEERLPTILRSMPIALHP